VGVNKFVVKSIMEELCGVTCSKEGLRLNMVSLGNVNTEQNLEQCETNRVLMETGKNHVKSNSLGQRRSFGRH
jgi:hypothetical protein